MSERSTRRTRAVIAAVAIAAAVQLPGLGQPAAATTLVSDLTELQAALANACADDRIILENDIDEPGAQLDIVCDTTLNLAGSDLHVRNIVIAPDQVLYVVAADGSILTADASAHPGLPGIENTDATLSVEGEATVVARGGANAAGIGGGDGEEGGSTGVTDNGTIDATGGDNGAGIGGGNNGPGDTTRAWLNGTIIATGGENAAGIGGGNDSLGGVTEAHDSSTITATGGSRGAGIGGGYLSGNGITEAHDSSTITATSDGSASAIGAGADDSTFGSLTLNDSSTLNLAGGLLEVWADGTVGPEMTVAPGATVNGTGGAWMTGTGQIDNQGSITLPSADIDDDLAIFGHHYAVDFDAAGGTPDPATPTTVYAASFTVGNRALPAAPARSGDLFTGWELAGTAFTADSTLPGSSADGTAVPLTADAEYVDFCTGGDFLLTDDLDVPDSALVLDCDTSVDLAGHDLDVRNVVIGSGHTFTVTDTTPQPDPAGTLTADASGVFGQAGIQNTGATFVVTGRSHIDAAGGLYAAGIGGSIDDGAGATIVSGHAVLDAIGGFYGSAVGSGAVEVAGLHVPGSGFGSLTLADSSTLRLPAGSNIRVSNSQPGADLTIAEDATVTGTGPGTYGTMSGNGQIDNQGTITLPSANVTGVQIFGHHYTIAFDPDGGTPTPSPITVYATDLTTGNRTLPTAPARGDDLFLGWDLAGAALTASSTLPGDSTDGSPVSLTADAQYLELNCTGTPVTLTDDISVPDAEMTIGCDVTIDLNGHDLDVRNVVIEPGNELTVTDTSAGPAGTLTADAAGYGTLAGIQTTDAEFTVTGRAQVVATGGASGAGVGGSLGENGGTTTADATSSITAQGGAGAAGIGGGGGGHGGTTTSNGASTIEATGGAFAAGIGGGDGGDGGTTTSNATTAITAEGGGFAAGIGGGSNGDGGTTTSNGASTITADGGGFAAGIGGGSDGDGGTTTSNATATITATGSSFAAGIGGGSNGDGGTTTSNGASTIDATGGFAGAGIGGGDNGDGGTTTAHDTSRLTADGGSDASAIGTGTFGTDFGSLTLADASTLRLPSGSDLVVPDSNGAGAEVVVSSTARIVGSADPTPTYGTISGAGQIDNQGTITLPSANVSGVGIFGHHYVVSFDTHGGTPVPGDITVFAADLATGNRTMPADPSRPGRSFDGWHTTENGPASPFTATSPLAGASVSGAAVASTAHARWSGGGLPSTFADPALTVTGTPRVGSPLTASITEPNLLGLRVTWQWQAITPGGAVDIPGATGATFTPTPDLAGTSLRVTVTLAAPGFTSRTEHADTDPVADSGAQPVVLTLTGTARVGRPLTANLETPGGPDTEVAWQWQALTRNGPVDIPGATDAVFTPTADQARQRLRVTVTLTTPGEPTRTGRATTRKVALGRIDLAGEIRGERRLRAWIDRADLPDGIELSYQWRADGRRIDGADDSRLRITRALAGKEITVVVGATAPGYRNARIVLGHQDG